MGEARDGRDEGRTIVQMTLFLSEKDVEGLLSMDEVVGAVEEAFRRQAAGEAFNSPRTRSKAPSSVLNVMHATLPYLGRGGLKSYMSTPRGTKFIVVLFDSKDSSPLAVLGADALGRFRTGATSGVATRHMYRGSSATLALFGSGRQALTQALAMSAVVKLEEVRVWSPDPDHRRRFAETLEARGFRAVDCGSPSEAAKGANVGCTITSSKLPFLSGPDVAGLDHLNLCGGNDPERSEISPDGVAAFSSVVVDDIPQGMVEYGDLIRAASSGAFDWTRVVPLSKVVVGSAKTSSPSLFKSGGAALEDVAVSSLIYDKALKSGRFADHELV